MDLDERVTATREVFRGKVVRLRVDTIRQADGREAEREVIDHSDSVCIVPLLADGSVVMVRQHRLPAGQALLEVPAGMLDEGEDPRACALRELEEETGYRAASIRPLWQAYLAPGYCTEKMHAFLATELTPGETNFDEGERIEMATMPMAEVEELILRGEIRDGKTIAAVLAARRLLG